MLRRPHQPYPRFVRGFLQLRVEERAVHHRLERLGEVGFDVFARVAFVVLNDEDVGGAEQLGLGPLFVGGQALLEIAGAREEQGRPAAAGGAGAGEAIHSRAGGELLTWAMHAETVQTT